MIEITISKNIAPSKISELHNKYAGQEQIGDISLIIPSEINKYSFGLLADLLKFVITLNSRHPIKNLKVDIEKEKLESLYDQEYAYPIISLLWNTASFIDKKGDNIKGILREMQNNFFQKMNSLKRIKGNKFILTSADHLPESKGLIRLLESSDGFNDNEIQIRNNIKKVLSEFVLTFNKNNLTEIEGIIGDIGAIIYELAKNTYEWGRTDVNSVDIPSSIRGIYFRFHRNNYENIIDEYYSTPLNAFFNNPNLKQNSLNENGQIYYLEILVFDSGVGFIEKFHENKNFKDIDVIKLCLIKNKTSSFSNLKSKKGIGLDRIINILNRKGFLRISTDKYCAYRDLIKDEYKPIANENLDDLILEDWNRRNFNSEFLSKSQGSYISILYPFKNIK